ncbi:DNA/RNA helicase, superfamily II, SNF2 family protein [Nitzschia inconspicua]|uniref:DNA/RNA helicase, superfamily II, SNF2 family protein n=1 Tax=Nitzschia inconspicua TaxID=303405 RepID=A0A9K3PJS4_9STRA|nr:DNA/RNA helicase, superfamily II, SNF2 family protein [Nitzschia inconspicua]
MVLYNPYMKKRPRSDDTSNTTTSVVYRPSNDISHGTIMSNDIGNIRSTYQPSTRLVGSNVVSERNCAYEAMSTNCSNGNNTSLIRTNTTINNQNTLNHSTSVITKESSPISTLSRNCSINQTKRSNTSTSTDTAPHEMDSKSIFADNPVRKPSPNPYLKRRNQDNSLSQPHGPGVSRVTQRQKVDTTSSQVQSALPQQSLPPISVPTTMQPHSMASIRPESWKSITNPLATNVKSSEAQSFVSRNPSQQIVCSPSQQQYSQKSTPVETPMAGLPNELMYSPEDIKPVNDSYRLKLIQNAELAKPLLNGWTIYPHQKKAIVRSLTMRRMILALDMGLGKTLIGAVWSKAFKKTFDNLKIFVISPVSLKEEWKRTVQEKVGLQVEEERSTKKCNKKSASQDDHDDDDDDNGLKLRICSWAKVPTKVDPNVEHFVVCCDEAHSMQSTQAQRTRDVLTLVSDKRCVGLLLLTGTPMKNGKPANLFPLLKAVRHPLGRHQKAFETHFCNGMLKNFGKGAIWDASGCSNLEQLKSLVSSNLLHMTKEQCLNDLPPMTNVMHDVPVSSRYQIQYEKAVKDLASVHANAKQLQDEAVLGAVQRVRITCAHAKIDAAVNLARTILNKEPALVIFSSFVEVAKQVHEKLSSSGWPSELLTGDTPQKKRQEMVDKFQSGLSSVFVCTFGAGGVGLTLTAACTIILLDRPWTPGETRQAEDRIRRIGQVKPCTSYWMRSFELDRQIDQVLASKDQTTKAVLNKTTEGSGGLSGPAAKISVAKLAQSFLLSKSRSQLPR